MIFLSICDSLLVYVSVCYALTYCQESMYILERERATDIHANLNKSWAVIFKQHHIKLNDMWHVVYICAVYLIDGDYFTSNLEGNQYKRIIIHIHAEINICIKSAV